ncbi:MAG: SRPBCC family protein [Candidatus Acidiferrum sp.]
MLESKDLMTPPERATRRQIIAGAALALGLASCAKLFAEAPPQAMKEIPSTPANDPRTALHQEVILKTTPQRIYEAILDSKQFTVFSGLPANIDPQAGGAFTMFGGLIEGRNVELTPSTRIVQAWRPAHWEPGVYSIVRFDFKPQADRTLVGLEHYGFPAGDYDHLYSGWTEHYFEPLKKYFT